MGVRGKLEAVIYAAEEPVTLAQLVSLFGEEALAERDARPGGEGQSHAAGPVFADASEELLLPLELSEDLSEDLSEAENEAPAPAPAIEDQPQGPAGDASGISAGPPAEATHEPVASDAWAARAARLRDRVAREEIRRILAELIAEYDGRERGMEIREIAGGYRIATKPEYHDAVRAFAKSLKPPMKLTLQALETLAVIAYKQPVTAPEVSEIRGVDSGGVLGSLISRKLVTTAGRKQVIGRPILYKTTKEFLLRFGLKDLAELPSMEEFEKMAGELGGLGEEPAAPEQTASLLEPAAQTEQSGNERSVSMETEEPIVAGVSVGESGAIVSESSEALEESTGN